VDFLDGDLRSRVTGAAVLIDARPGVAVADQIRAASDSGARAVLVAGEVGPSVAGVVDARDADVPAVVVDRGDARELRSVIGSGTTLRVSLDVETGDNRGFGTVAGFSSGGPTLAGRGR